MFLVKKLRKMFFLSKYISLKHKLIVFDCFLFKQEKKVIFHDEKDDIKKLNKFNDYWHTLSTIVKDFLPSARPG